MRNVVETYGTATTNRKARKTSPSILIKTELRKTSKKLKMPK